MLRFRESLICQDPDVLHPSHGVAPIVDRDGLRSRTARVIPNLPLEATTVTMRKTLIGTAACLLLLFVGPAGIASAQDSSDTTGSDTTSGDTTGSDTTSGDTTGSDTTSGDTTGSDTTSGDTTGSDTTGSDTTSGDTTGSDTGADSTGSAQPSVPLEPATTDATAATDATDAGATTGAPTTTATDATAAAAAASGTDEVLGEVQLAFTGPDTRIATLGLALLGAGAMATVASRRRDH